MQEVTSKINELVTLLQDKIKATESLNQQLSQKKISLEDVERKQLAAANALAARERILSKYEDFDKEKSNLKESIKRNLEMKIENTKRSEKLEQAEKSLKEKAEELDTMTKLYITKNGNMDSLKIQLETERKLMKEKILEEIKGKL